MAFGAFEQHRQQALMADINVTPMVDVMLVLLVIFIMAAPALTSAVKLELPQAPALAQQPPRGATVNLAIDAKGNIFWNDEAVDAAAFNARLAQAATLLPQPELQLRADKQTRYEVVAGVMAAAQQNGLFKLGFITDPIKKQRNN